MVLKMVENSDELSPFGRAVALIVTAIFVAWVLYKDSIMAFWNNYWLVIIGLVILVIFLVIADLVGSLSIGVAGVIIFSILTIWGLFGGNIVTLWIQYQWVIVGLGIPLIIGIVVISRNVLEKIKIDDALLDEKLIKEQELHKGIIKKQILKEKAAQLEDLTDEEKEYLLNKWVDEEYFNELSGNSSNEMLCDSSNNQSVKEPKTKTEIVRPLSHSKTQRLITEIGTKCCYPDCKENITLEVHHIIPRSEGGSNKENNLIVLCNNHHKKADVGIIPKQRLKHHSIAKIKQNRRI